jgi:hypothetical protein
MNRLHRQKAVRAGGGEVDAALLLRRGRRGRRIFRHAKIFGRARAARNKPGPPEKLPTKPKFAKKKLSEIMEKW